MKVLILVPDGVGVRNYLYSNLLCEFSKKDISVSLWSAFAPDMLDELKIPSQRNILLPCYKESFLEKFLRESCAYARIMRNARVSSNESIRKFWNPNKNRIAFRFFYGLVSVFAHCMSRFFPLIKFFDHAHLSLVRHNKFSKAFQDVLYKEHPDWLLCLHQRSLNALPAVEMANKLGIKTATVIYSWDNLPKGRLPIRTSLYLLWSEYMKDEFQQYYPEIPKECLIVTGTPQFDFYLDKSLIESREVFCSKMGLNPMKRIVCFSGDDTLTSPFDPLYLRDMAAALSLMDEAKRPQILLRRCPVDLTGRFNPIAEQYRKLVYVWDPIWKSSTSEDKSWVQMLPMREDVKLLINIAYHCDTVVNVGSTMALDFAMFDKPALFINYDQQESSSWRIKTIYEYQHFRSMPDANAVGWIDNAHQMESQILKAIEHPDKVAASRKQWLHTVVSLTPESSSSRIVKALCTSFS